MAEQFELLKTRLMAVVLIELVSLIIFHVFLNDYLWAVQYAFLLLNFALILYMYITVVMSNKQRVLSVTRIIGSGSKTAFEFGKIGIVTYDDQQVITWMSELFDDLNVEGIGEPLFSVFPQARDIILGNSQSATIHYEDLAFEISPMGHNNVLYFKDTTAMHALQVINASNQVVLGIAHLDNYEETTQYEEENTIAYIDANIRQAVVRWADTHQIFLRRIRQDRYLLILNERIFQKITKERFDILHDIRKASAKIDASITLSLAFARMSDNFKELDDMSNRALELAQSRGGDQAAINTKNEGMRYYGGSSEAVEKRSKVRVRVIAQNLGELITSSKNVVVVGHKMMDFDCFGSAVGISAIASVYDKEVSIVLDLKDTENKLAGSYVMNQKQFESHHNFISYSQAKDIIKAGTLLIMVDHHSIEQTQFPDLVTQAQNIVIIDHHRRTQEFAFKPVLSYIEPSASSASELVIELFPYHRKNVVVSKLDATFMYTGMLIDTNRFRNRSGSRTFEAASELRKYGADLNEADNMLKDKYEDFELKNKVLSHCELHDDGYVIVAYKDGVLPRPIMSQVADEVLSVRNVEASFVVSYVSDEQVAISARSKGDLNVQLVMERLGGGGHFTGAAAQIKGQSINEVVGRLKDSIAEVKKESQ